MSVFLSAQWLNLLLFTYKVSKDKLLPYLPKGLTFDTLEDGEALVSLVAFQFVDTRVLGIHVPFHVNFPEVNLRFYVRKGDQRGVCFIREIVPRPCITLVAQKLYNEPYVTMPMRDTVTQTDNSIALQYSIQQEGSTHIIYAEGDTQRAFLPLEGSVEHFLKEQELGFGTDKKGNTLQYSVKHPHWQVYPVLQHQLQLDFGKLYGAQWAFLNQQQPFHITFAQGSPIQVMKPVLA